MDLVGAEGPLDGDHGEHGAGRAIVFIVKNSRIELKYIFGYKGSKPLHIHL